MKFYFTGIFSATLVLSLTQMLHPPNVFAEEMQQTFMPKNGMYIPSISSWRSGIDQAQFNETIDKFEKTYRPIVADLGGTLSVNRLWDDGTVNASASRQGDSWIVNMYGGLARHKVVTQDGFALVLCHEIAHHLGGAPKVPVILFPSWASNEGQSDYFGAMKCLRRGWDGEDHTEAISSIDVDPIVVDKCHDSFNTTSEQALCIRIGMAGWSLAKLLGGEGAQISFSTPDTSRVFRTDHRHPQAQCRLDTYLAGATCTKGYEEDVSQRNTKTGVCNRSEGFTSGQRPRCWFKPRFW